MKLLFAVILVSCAFYVYATPVSNRDVRPRVVEQYEVDLEQYAKDPRKAKRWLTGVTFHDRSGKVSGRWDLVNDASGAYYRKHVFTYDRVGRTTAELVFESARTSPGQYFSVSRSGRSIKVVPELAETQTSIMISKYNQRGMVAEEEDTFDSDGDLQQRIVRGFDGRGRPISFHESKGDSSVICESGTVYSADGLVSTQTYRNCPVVLKIVSRLDSKGRPILDEQYSRGSAENGGDPVLTSRAIKSYSGDVTNLDWMFMNDKGEPTLRLIIIAKGDYELSRKEFVPASPATGADLKWTFSEEETREYQFDKLGTVTKEIWKKRNAGEEFRFTLVVERVVSYL